MLESLHFICRKQTRFTHFRRGRVPCIERNAMGAVKAINACRMAMNETEGHKISLDQIIETMYRTGLDMQSRYKETSLAGLALNVIEC